MRIFIVCLAIVFSALPAFAQGTINERGIYVPTEAELERHKRLTEIVKKPADVFTLRLLFSRGLKAKTESEEIATFNKDDRIQVEMVLTHQYFEGIPSWESAGPHANTRLELVREGTVVSYSKQAQRYVDRDNGELDNGSGSEVILSPFKEYRLTGVFLKDWYDPLESGFYQLVVKKRFVWNGDWLQSNSISFEIK